MALQYVTAMVDLGMRHDTVVQIEPPVSYPEFLVIQAINGGSGSTTDACEVSVDPDGDTVAERERLVVKYGKPAIDELFPGVLARIPERGDLPTLEDMLAAKNAAAAAKAKVLSGAKAAAAKKAASKSIAAGGVDGANDLTEV